jgi:integrase
MHHYAYPIIGALDVRAITITEVLRVLEQKVPALKGQPDSAGTFWTQRTVTADRTRNRIERVLSWAATRGYRAKGDNPAAWVGNLKDALPAPTKVTKVVAHAAVPYAEVPGIITALDQREGVTVKALKFLILTAARRSETTGALWTEIDFKERMWTIPAERMKAGREHRVPLSDAAIDALKSLPTERDNPHVFIGAFASVISETAMWQMLSRIKPGVTVHGFRSSFSDWAHETTAFSNHVIELSLAHSIGTASEKAYRRGDLLDKRRKLMEAWAAHCCSTPRAVAADNVEPIRGRV